MKKFKKALALLLVIVLTAGIAIAGTIAYLTDTDSAVNTMTVGNVDIIQHEQKRDYKDGAYTGLTDFQDDVPLYPITLDPYAGYSNYYDGEWKEAAAGAEYGMFSNNNNAVDKIVTVENTGFSPAYVRTVFAFEMKMVDGAALDPVGSDVMYVVNDFDINWIKDNETSDEVDANNEYITIKLRNGNWYIVGVYYYDLNGDGIQESLLNPGETTEASLLQLYLKSIAGNEWYDQVGGKYEVLVLSQAIQSAGFAGAESALNEGFGVVNESNALVWFNGLVDEVVTADTWDGTSDTSWYNETDTEFMIMTAEQLAGFSELVDGGNTFAGKTVKVGQDINLEAYDAEGERVCFNPIGSYKNDKAFMGTFDGLGHTISNMSQNTWALDTGYYYGDLGLGLFSLVEDATVRNLNMDAASISGESAICGTVAACAYGDTTFENINVTNTEVADYQYYAGGVVGWASGNHKYLNCDVAASTTIGAQWGDFDNSTGGVIGGAGANATIYMKDCDVACRIDGYNDVTSSYQWYAYRRCGMLIGNTGKTEKIDDTTYASAPQLTCENVTVTYGEWANYTYCEFAGKNWPYVRVQAGISNSAYSNPRYGHPTDANGNEVLDDNHVHNDGEDHHILCAFDQLYGGGQGVYGTAAHEGVTVIYNNK